jgi:hypothetical protein
LESGQYPKSQSLLQKLLGTNIGYATEVLTLIKREISRCLANEMTFIEAS